MTENTGIQLHSGEAAPIEKLRPAPWVAVEHNRAMTSADLWFFWRAILQRRWVILGVFAVVFLGVLAGTLLQTPIYRATGLLEIRKENADVVPVETLSTLERITDEYLETQFGILKSQTLAQRVIHQVGIEKVEEFNPPPSGWSFRFWSRDAETPAPGDLAQRVLDRFQKRLAITPLPGSRLVNVSFESQDPELAAKVVNVALSTYIEMRMEMGQKAAEWLSSQLAETKTKLEESETKLQRYANENGLLFLENKGATENIVDERLRQLQMQMTQAQGNRIEKQSVYDLVVQKGEYESIPGVYSDVMKDLTIRVAELKREYARLASTFKPDYPKSEQVKSQIDEVEAQLKQERQRVTERMTNEYHAAVQREELLRQAFKKQEEVSTTVTEKTGRYNILKRDMEANRQLYDALQQKLKEAGVSAGLKASNAGIVDTAKAPRRPDRPNLLVNLSLALIVGLVLGIGTAFVQEYLDTRVRTAEEISSFSEAPALAMIPSISSVSGHRQERKDGAGRRLLPMTAGKAAAGSPEWYRIDKDRQRYSALAEAFGGLRTSILLGAAGPRTRSLLVTSSQPGEGKTTVSSNLAISLAQLGRRVLLIDADIRRPCLHRVFRAPNHAGLADVLAEESEASMKRSNGRKDWRNLVHRNLVTGLDLLTSGVPPENPAELLSSLRMRHLVSEALLSYDFVLLDSPALFINAADARILARLVDGSVLVVRSGYTPRDVVQRALAQANNVIGIVLNALDIRGLPAYYRAYYGTEGGPTVGKTDSPPGVPNGAEPKEGAVMDSAAPEKKLEA